MGVDDKSGILKVADGAQPYRENDFHKLLSQIRPQHFQLERMSIFEQPMRAEMVYAAKAEAENKQVVTLELSEDEGAIYYNISAP